MAFISFHAGSEGKIRRNDIRGMSGHTFRKSDERYKKHGNENIRSSFTDFNLDWLKGDAKNIEQAVNERLESYSGKRALRKDAVILREVIVQLSPEEFNTGDVASIYDDREKAVKFTDDMVDVLKDEWGEENILGYSVHMDESNPHAHILMMPMTDDGRLSQKDFFKGPQDLKRQHRVIREKMADKGWNVENENKYIDVDGFDLPTYKRNAVKIDELRQKQTDDLRNLHTPELLEDAKRAFIAEYVDKGMAISKRKQEEEEERLEAKRADIERREKTLGEHLEELDRRDAEAAAREAKSINMLEFATAVYDSRERDVSLPELSAELKAITDGKFAVMRNNRSNQPVYVRFDDNNRPRATTLNDVVGHIYDIGPDGVDVDARHEKTGRLSVVAGRVSLHGMPMSDDQAGAAGFKRVVEAVNEKSLEYEKEQGRQL